MAGGFSRIDEETSSASLSIGGLSQATGIPIATLRNWEKRYGFPEPRRRQSGHRRYPMDLVPRLQLIRRALDAGFRPSSVVNVEESDLRRLLATADSPGESKPSGRGPLEATREMEQWLAHLEKLDADGLQRGFLRGWSAWGARGFVLELAVPFMREVGRRWSRRDLVVMHEHFVSELLRGFLAQQIRNLSQLARGPRVVCAGLPGEQHSLGLQMAAVLLTLADLEVVYLGADTPIEQIVGATMAGDVRAVIVASSAAADPAQVTQIVSNLRERLTGGMPLVVGGQAAVRSVDGVEWLDSLSALERWAADTLSRRQIA